MKKVLFVLFLTVLLVSCGEFRHRDLYEKTDYFVESLHTTIESYGLLGGSNYTKYAEDGKYKIMPIGRLVNVRIEEYATAEDYEDLRKSLENHYKGDSRVNNVYICSAGTVMIDCRN